MATQTVNMQKKHKVINTMVKREVERQLDLKREKEDRENYSAENEKLDYFEKSFANKYHEILYNVDLSERLPVEELADHFDSISKNILILQKYVAASNIFLTTYNIKKYQKNIDELVVKLKDLEDRLIPKKKFGFKNKNKAKADAKRNGHDVDEVDFKKREVIDLNENFCGFKQRAGEVVQLKAGEILKKDVQLNYLADCTVMLFGSPSTVHMSHLKNCYIFCGPVSTSIFVENCENCTLVIACQQLRLHSSTNINIYLHVTSRAIMEDCKKIYLAPYNLNYDGMLEDFKTSGLDITKNHWKDVDDFNWLNIGKQSPNWSLMEDAKIIRNWDHIFNET